MTSSGGRARAASAARAERYDQAPAAIMTMPSQFNGRASRRKADSDNAIQNDAQLIERRHASGVAPMCRARK